MVWLLCVIQMGSLGGGFQFWSLCYFQVDSQVLGKCGSEDCVCHGNDMDTGCGLSSVRTTCFSEICQSGFLPVDRELFLLVMGEVVGGLYYHMFIT